MSCPKVEELRETYKKKMMLRKQQKPKVEKKTKPRLSDDEKKTHRRASVRKYSSKPEIKTQILNRLKETYWEHKVQSLELKEKVEKGESLTEDEQQILDKILKREEYVKQKSKERYLKIKEQKERKKSTSKTKSL